MLVKLDGIAVVGVEVGVCIGRACMLDKVDVDINLVEQRRCHDEVRKKDFCLGEIRSKLSCELGRKWRKAAINEDVKSGRK